MSYTQGENLAAPSPPDQMSTAEFVRRWPGSERIIALLEAVDNFIEIYHVLVSTEVRAEAMARLVAARDAMQEPPAPRAKPEHRHQEGRR